MAIARTPEEEQAVRDNLVSICAKVFLRDGYSKVTMKSLSDEAGCTTGKFYSNFAGKPDSEHSRGEAYSRELRGRKKIDGRG